MDSIKSGPCENYKLKTLVLTDLNNNLIECSSAIYLRQSPLSKNCVPSNPITMETCYVTLTDGLGRRKIFILNPNIHTPVYSSTKITLVSLYFYDFFKFCLLCLEYLIVFVCWVLTPLTGYFLRVSQGQTGN